MFKAKLTLGLLTLMVASCSQFNLNLWGTITEPEAAEDVFTLSQNQPFTYQSTRFAFGNCWVEDYTDDQNQPQKSLRCALWSWSQTLPYNHVRVYAGQTLTIGEYQIRIFGIEQQSQGTFTMQIGIKATE
ncbi:MAG: hypothetical protein MUF87_18585 [Anaerolineae bacterium]|jgi:hypothetical protein|nr:hypothetical protein [Anaerolineae bacterium]